MEISLDNAVNITAGKRAFKCRAATVSGGARAGKRRLSAVSSKKSTSAASAARNSANRAGGLGAPATVRLGAGIGIVQSIAVIIFGIFLIVHEVTHPENPSLVSETAATDYLGLGTAIFIFIVFGFVIVSAIAMTRGRKWGRGAVLLVQFILAASSFQMFSGGAIALGIATLVSALAGIYLLMVNPISQEWFQQNF